MNFILMVRPLTGDDTVSMSGYWSARPFWHIWGALWEEPIWCTGAVFNFVCFPRARRRAGGFLLHWPGRNHDLRRVGRLCLA